MGEILRDKNGSKIAEIKQEGSKKVIYDKTGHKLGYFDGRETRDYNGKLIGPGDWLTSLVKN